MKPNDKAIEAAATSLFGNYMGGEKKWIEDALTAAFAAQFQSGDYAGLVERLRDDAKLGDPICDEAADAIEALLAERDALKAENDQHKSVYQKYVEAIDRMNGTPCEQVRHHYEVSELRSELALAVSERDALAARLAPVDDEALVEIVAVYCSPEMNWNEMSEKWKNSCRRDARAAIAAIRPHIEAAERERCAKVAEGFSSNRDWVPGSLWGNIRNEIAAAIRSGSGSVK